MAEYEHFYAEQNTVQTSTSAANTTALSISGSVLQHDTKYLVLVRALIGGSNTADGIDVFTTVADPTWNVALYTLFQFQPAVSGVNDLKLYSTVFSYTTNAGTPDNIDLVFRNWTAGNTARVDQASIFVINLDDIGTEGTDYHEDFDYTGTAADLAVNPSYTLLGGITGSLMGADPHLVFGSAQINCQVSDTRYDVVCHTALPSQAINAQIREGIQDTLEDYRAVGFWAFQDATSSSDILVRANCTGSGDAKDGGYYVIAIAAAMFASVGVAFDPSVDTVGTSEITVVSETYQPTIAGNHLILSRFQDSSTSAGRYYGWVEDGTTEIRIGDSTPIQTQEVQAVDLEQVGTMQRVSLDTTERTFNVKAKATAASLLVTDRLLVLWNLNGFAVLESEVRPIADTSGVGWDSAPTASQDLWAQVDEVTPSDTDYIFTEDPNP